MFLEALSSQEIIDVSKRWQAKVASADNFSVRELYDLTSDVTRIRETVGLMSGRGISRVADFSHNMTNIRLVSFLGNPNEQVIDIVVQQLENNPQELSDAYHLEKKVDEYGIFTGEASRNKDLISIRHSAGFKSLLVEGLKVAIKGEQKYEYEDLVPWDRKSISELAKAIWNAHLEQDAPLKNEYLPPVTPAAL